MREEDSAWRHVFLERDESLFLSFLFLFFELFDTFFFPSLIVVVVVLSNINSGAKKRIDIFILLIACACMLTVAV